MIRKILFCLVLVIFSFVMISCSANEDTLSAMEFAASMKIGWNLGNTFDGHRNLMPDEIAWQNAPITQELFEAVAAYGFGAVRIPVTWGQKLHPELRNSPTNINLTIDEIKNLKIDEEWLERIAEVVNFALNAGLKAIINIHHDGADSYHWLSVKNTDLDGESKEKVDAIFTTLWTQIAQRFKDLGTDLVFEGFNELHDGSWGDGNILQHRRINELNQLFVDTVRAVGGQNRNRFLLIHGWVTRPSVTVSSLTMPTDTAKDKIIVGIHFYDPYDFSGSARQNVWGENALPGNWANESFVRRTFDSVKSRFIDNGIPIILGEYGAVNQPTESGREFRRYYMEYVTKYAVDCGFIPFYWDNAGFGEGSEKFGLISRWGPDFEIDHYGLPILEAMMRAAYSDYELSDIVVPAP